MTKINSPGPTPLIPPDDSMWQRYSAHYELPLAGATSIFLHGVILGVLAIGGIAFFFSFNLDAAKPPRMDVVMIEGNGTGFEGFGAEPGLPGAPDASARTEQVSPLPDQPPSEQRPPSLLPKDVPPELDLPIIDDGKLPASTDLTIELTKIAKDAEAQVREAMKLEKAPPMTMPKKFAVGTNNPKGQGGKDGSGSGPFAGNKQGPGTGVGGPGGRKATKQEIFAWRWRFDLSGAPAEHARKLAAMGVTLAIPEPDLKPGFFLVTDLKRRPVEMNKDSLEAFKDAVKWYNTKPESLQGLARELQLPYVPKFVVLLLPKDREEKMAAEEAAYAKSHRRDVMRIQATWFDFRLRNGVYDPAVIRQE